jgi:cyclophilin family peptidyl-prolyl cis-trans isomerase/protein-disulfide isomerase
MSMQKAIFLLPLALLLAACTAPGAAEPTATTAAPIQEAEVAEPASCTAVASEQRQAVLDSSPVPPITDEDWSRGPADATITILEYSDFQCPFCATLHASLIELEAKYPNDLRVVFRHFPLIGTEEEPLHEKAALAMQASEAAGLQDKFWEMHDLLFDRQAEWTELAAADFEAWLLAAAAELGLDTAQFESELFSEALVAQAQAAWEAGQAIPLSATPSITINGLPYQGPLDALSLETIIKLELLVPRQFDACPDFTIDQNAQYAATLHTEKGDIVIQLFPEIAPTAVNSFVFLAQNDWFDDVTFHRVLPNFVAQAGDPTGTGFGGPGYAFGIETDPNLGFDRPGLLAMANSGPTSNGSQFFITLGPAEHLNGGYTIFGEVLAGMDVVESLTARDPSQEAGLPPGDLIQDVSIEVE